MNNRTRIWLNCHRLAADHHFQFENKEIDHQTHARNRPLLDFHQNALQLTNSPLGKARTQLHIKAYLKNYTVLERHGFPQSEQTKLSTASVDSTKLACLVSSACSCASSTDFSSVPQSPHFNENPAMVRFRSEQNLSVIMWWNRPIHWSRARLLRYFFKLGSKFGGKWEELSEWNPIDWRKFRYEGEKKDK